MNEYGRKLIPSKYTIQNVNEYWGSRKFFDRHARWGEFRWNIGGVRYLNVRK
ncbi:MAG TPA: hypothetical protein VK435_03540 [Thermodesulfovibrionales bacterium]|nr:hypothetical protein [Thermodesulfovibrionales bacterium]